MASSVQCLFGDTRKKSSMCCLLGDIRNISLSDERDDSDKVSVHEDATEESERREKNLFFHFQCNCLKQVQLCVGTNFFIRLDLLQLLL